MNYNILFNNNISQLGIGYASQQPSQHEKITDLAFQNGINYFEAATFYLNGKCENIVGNALKKYKREQFFLCDKISIIREKLPNENACELFFNNQLKKCSVDYFDIYLIQGVNKAAIDILKKMPFLLNFFNKKRKEGKIKKLGFSYHDNLENLQDLISLNHWDIAQIQINFFDWYAGRIKDIYLYLTNLNIPIIAMCPSRGAKIFSEIPIEEQEKIQKLFPTKNVYDLSLIFLQQLSNVKIILTGAANTEQLQQNINIINQNNKYYQSDKIFLQYIIFLYQNYNIIPCTGCKYCEAVCPKNIKIAEMFKYTNNILFKKDININRDKLLEITKSLNGFYACINCHSCEKICPQHLPITKLFYSSVRILEG